MNGGRWIRIAVCGGGGAGVGRMNIPNTCDARYGGMSECWSKSGSEMGKRERKKRTWRKQVQKKK